MRTAPRDLTPHVAAVEGDPSVVDAMARRRPRRPQGRARDTPLTAAGLARYPLPALRPAYLAGAYVVYSIQDRWR